LENGRTGLRPPGDEDLEPDHLLAGLFLIDFQHLTALERRILLLVAEHTILAETDLLRLLGDQQPDRVRTFLWGLEKLGHVRQVLGQWTVGNEYLRRWLNHEWQQLTNVQETPLDENSFEALLQAGHAQEVQAYESEVAHLENRYAELMANHHRGERSGERGAETWADDLNRLQRFLTAAHRDLQRSQGGDLHRGANSGASNQGAGSAADDPRPLFRPRLRRDV
jgi:hypothetical protein